LATTSRTVLQANISIVVEHRSTEHWFLDKQGKLQSWRDWRTQLSAMDNESACQEVAIWWKFVPLVAKTFDPWREETWPDPWTLVSGGSFCPSAQGLGMFYSLVLAKIDCKLVLAVINEQPRLLVEIGNSRLLNYYDGEIIDTETADLQILKSWAPSDLVRLVKV
jgi:hypothetical protein